MSWDDFQRQQGAVLAADGIPLHYGDLKAEYHAALDAAVLMERSHEGRLEGRGRSRIDLIQRISTNDLLGLPPDRGRPTLFTNANGRILDRVMVYHRGDTVFVTTEAGRAGTVLKYLQRQIFFGDDFHLTDLANETRLFTLHGPNSEALLKSVTDLPHTANTAHENPVYRSFLTTIAGHQAWFLERKPVSGAHWAVVISNEGAQAVWTALMESGKTMGLIPAGSLTYNTLRIRAGRPAAGRELSADYIPLEVGLWDEVSFSKGCYTGQEIIARMESRNKLAKVMVKVSLSQMVDAPTLLYHEAKSVGTLTSSVMTPDGDSIGIGFVKTALAHEQQSLTVGEDHIKGIITELAGVQPSQSIAQEI
jgi:tRNA-modifying protein YgfZ